MKRRSLIKSAAALPAAAISSLSPSAVAQSSSAESAKLSTIAPDQAGKAVRRFFSPEQFAALEKLGEILVPPFNGRPGAKEADAAAFLDFLISESPADRQGLYRTGLDRLNSDANRLHGKPFASLSAEQIGPMLSGLTGPWTYAPPSEAVTAFLVAAKEDFLRATINSRAFAGAAGSRSSSGTGYYWLPIE